MVICHRSTAERLVEDLKRSGPFVTDVIFSHNIPIDRLKAIAETQRKIYLERVKEAKTQRIKSESLTREKREFVKVLIREYGLTTEELSALGYKVELEDVYASKNATDCESKIDKAHKEMIEFIKGVPNSRWNDNANVAPHSTSPEKGDAKNFEKPAIDPFKALIKSQKAKMRRRNAMLREARKAQADSDVCSTQP